MNLLETNIREQKNMEEKKEILNEIIFYLINKEKEISKKDIIIGGVGWGINNRNRLIMIILRYGKDARFLHN